MPSVISAGTTAGSAIAITGDTTGNLAFQTNGTTTAMTINTSQDIGIGTTSPQNYGGYKTLTINGSTGGILQLQANGTSGLRIVEGASQLELFEERNVPMLFATNNTERMRITSGGDALIGTTTSSGKFTVNQTDTGTRTISASSPTSYAATVFRSDSAATSGTGWYHLYGSSSSGTVNNIFIYGNGNIQNANNSYGAISDIKLKENIVDATPKLDKLMQVKVRNYNLKGEYEQHKQIGVIAQELETVFPSLIEETQDRGENDAPLGTTTKSVKYSVFVPILIKAIQELKAELDATKAEVAALKGA